MEFPVKDIARLLNGIIEGKDDFIINNLSTLEAGKEGCISFLSNPKYENQVYSTEASAVIVSDDFVAQKPLSTTLIRVSNPYVSFTKLLEEYDKALSFRKEGIEEPSYIGVKTTMGKGIYLGAFAYLGEGVSIGDNVKIYPNCTIGDNVTIGDSTILYAGVKVYENTKIGRGCIIHSGAVIGSDGFGFAPQDDGTYRKIPQLGNVILEDNVEIGGNTVIDCATLDSTIIGQGTKIDNLVQIAHNVKIGSNTVMAGQSCIAGSTTIGNNCMIGGQAAIAGHIIIADRVTIGAKAGVANSLKKSGEILLGSPAIDIKKFRRSSVIFKKLPELNDKINKLEKEISSLKE